MNLVKDTLYSVGNWTFFFELEGTFHGKARDLYDIAYARQVMLLHLELQKCNPEDHFQFQVNAICQLMIIQLPFSSSLCAEEHKKTAYFYQILNSGNLNLLSLAEAKNLSFDKSCQDMRVSHDTCDEIKKLFKD